MLRTALTELIRSAVKTRRSQGTFGRSLNDRQCVIHRKSTLRRALSLEPLEDRRVLSTFAVMNTNDTGAGSLRQAILNANSSPGADVVQFGSGVSGTITLTSGQLAITDAVDLQGPGSGVIAVSGNNASRVFNVSANSSISGLRIVGGSSSTGIIYNSDTLTVSQSTFEGNAGSSIYNTGILTVDDSKFIRNEGVEYGTFTIPTTINPITGDPYNSRGPGGIYNSGTLTVNRSEFAGNVGGGIFNTLGTLAVNDSTFRANTGATFKDPNLPDGDPFPPYTISVGSGIYNTDGGLATVSGSTFSENIGSGIFSYYNASMASIMLMQTRVIVSSSTFSENIGGVGGGLFSLGAEADVSNSTFVRNVATGIQFASGGAIDAAYAGSILRVNNSTFYENRAEYGGAITVWKAADFLVSDSTFVGNHANLANGGIFYPSSPLKLNNSILADNTSGQLNSPSDLSSPDPFSPLQGSNNLITAGSRPGLTNTIVADPNLGPLANYGGPTRTMALLPGSPAIDAGSDSLAVDPITLLPLTTDQRGSSYARIYGPHVDIGAFESSGPGLVVVGTAGDDIIEVAGGSLAGTLKTTINGVVTNNIVVVGLFTVKGLGGNDSITIKESLAGGVIVDGGDDSDNFTVNHGGLNGPVVITDTGVAGTDAITVNGTGNDDVIIKTSELGTKSVYIRREALQPETVDATEIEHVTIHGRGGDDTINDPGYDTEIFGDEGNDTIIVSQNIGQVTVDGGEGSDTYIIRAMSSYLISRQFIGLEGDHEYIIQAGNPQGPVSIYDTGAAGTNAVTVQGTSEADTITQTGDQVVVNGTTITLVGVVVLAVDGGGGTGDMFTIVGTPTVTATVQGVSDLVVVGTPGNDQILFIPGDSAGQVIAKLNGVVVASSSPTGRIVAYGLAGDDDIQVAGGIAVPAWLYGDAGNDRLNAGNGGSLLFGGDGNDQLLGGGGRDVMIGGNGADHLVGNGNDDILVAGFTRKDDRSASAHYAFWSSILSEWNNVNHGFHTRVQNLSAPGGLLPEVVDDCFDDDMDLLNGGAGDDWLIFAVGEDKVTGKAEASN